MYGPRVLPNSVKTWKSAKFRVFHGFVKKEVKSVVFLVFPLFQPSDQTSGWPLFAPFWPLLDTLLDTSVKPLFFPFWALRNRWFPTVRACLRHTGVQKCQNGVKWPNSWFFTILGRERGVKKWSIFGNKIAKTTHSGRDYLEPPVSRKTPLLGHLWKHHFSAKMPLFGTKTPQNRDVFMGLKSHCRDTRARDWVLSVK